MNSISIPSTKRIGEDMLMLFHFDRRKKSEKEKKPPRFLVLRRKWLTLGAAVLAAAAIFAAVNYPAAVSASAATRQLPIYCVQRDQKVCSISFDAAWGADNTQKILDVLKEYGVDSCFSFQGKFFHFLTINRHRKIEYDLLYPASVFPFLREHLNSLDKGLHKLLLLRFRCGMVDFIKCQQQAIDIVSGNLLLLDAADLTLQFANLNFDFLYGVILLIIAALQVQNLSVIVGIIDVQGIHLTLQAAFRSKGLL